MKIRRNKTRKVNNDKSCRCESHTSWGIDGSKVKKISACKKFRSSIIRNMRDMRFLTPRGDYLCESCYQQFQENYRSEEEEVVEESDDIDESLNDEITEESIPVEDVIQQLIHQLENKTFHELYEGNEQLWGKLVELIGERLCRKAVYDDGMVIRSCYKNKVFLTDLNILKYIRERNQILVKFLCGLTGLRYEQASNQIQFTFATTLEMCYYLRNLNLVLPYSFLSNLIQSCISGSKSVSVVNGKTSPSGSYATYKKWITDKGSNSLVAHTGTIEVWFDNIGRYINKQYRVSSTKMKAADIVTTCLQISHKDASNLQEDQSLKPERNIDNLEDLHSRMNDKINEGNDNFRTYRYRFVEQMLRMVADENDCVQKRVDTLQTIRRLCTNPKCSIVYDTKIHGMKRKCDKCGESVTKEANQASCAIRDPFLWEDMESINIGQKKESEVHADVSMAESILKNPNSYKNIEFILDEIKLFACIPSMRAWLFLGCDGPPYCLSERLAEEDPKRFGWAHFIPGLGHLHMNMMKTLFKILDAIILEPLGREVLNFESPKAHKFFIDAKDTHKSWQTIQVLLFGTTMELCREYINKKSQNDVNAIGFLEWISQAENSSTKLIGEVILNYTLAIYFEKIGARNNDVKLVDAARFKFDDLFYAFRHPIYREVEYRDLRNRVLYKDPVRKFREEHMSFSETSVPGKSQGGDFILEGKVQRQKMIAPKGIINCETWQKMARCLDEFEEIYDAASSKLNIGGNDTAKSINLVDEIIKWRAILRISQYLRKPNFNPVPKSIYDELLSNDMVNFSGKVKQKREECWKLLEQGDGIVTVKYPYMVVLPGQEIDDLLHTLDQDEDE